MPAETQKEIRLYVISDIHIEFDDFAPPPIDAAIIVLAGDIGVGTSGIDWAAAHFPGAPVVYVPGNHEYYRHDIGIIDQLKTAAPANVHVLSNDTFEIEPGSQRTLIHQSAYATGSDWLTPDGMIGANKGGVESNAMLR